MLDQTAIGSMFLPEQAAGGSAIFRAGFKFVDEGLSWLG